MRPAVEHLRNLRAFVINLDRSMDRMMQFHSRMSYLFDDVIRVEAVDWSTISEAQAQSFGAAWRSDYASLIEQDVYPAVLRPMKGTGQLTQQRLRTTYAIQQSWIRALRAAIESNLPRFVICEDDVVPRSSLHYEDMPTPTGIADVAIWSGGVPLAAIGTDDKHFLAGKPHAWRRMPRTKQAHTLLGAGVVEMSPHFARLWVDAMEKWTMPSDHALGFAVREVDLAQRLYPTAFGQIGESVRNGKQRDQALERSHS